MNVAQRLSHFMDFPSSKVLHSRVVQRVHEMFQEIRTERKDIIIHGEVPNDHSQGI